MRVAIMQADSNGCFPIPASKGGAVSTLVEHLIEDNSREKQADLTVVSYYDEEAERLSKKYKNVEFVWVKIPKAIKVFDNIGFWGIKTFFPRKKAVSFKSLFSLLWYICFGTKFLKKNQFDKLVLENNIPMARMIKDSHYKGEYYYHFHNVPRLDAHCRDVFENCNGYLCVSQYVANQITSAESAIGRIPKEKAHVLYNCIDTELFKPITDDVKLAQYRERYGLQKEDKIAIFAGRLSEEKGIDVVIRAIKEIPDVKLLVVGSYMHHAKVSDPYQDMLIKLTEQIKDRVIFTGYIEQREMPILYSLADVAVLPSMWDEPAGLTMVEAIACGIPVITTRSGGIPEYAGKETIVLDRNELLVNEVSNKIKNAIELEKNYFWKDKETIIPPIFSVKGYISRMVSEIK